MPAKRKAEIVEIAAILGSLKDEGGTDIQAVIFPFTPAWESEKTREQWLLDNDYQNNGCEETNDGYKCEQTPEDQFDKDSLHTVAWGHPDFRDSDADQNGEDKDEPSTNGNGERKRVIFRMSPSLHERLREYANREDLSTNQLVCRALQKYLDDGNGGNQTDTQSPMQELRDLKEARDLLDAKKEKGLIEKLQEHIRQCVQKMTGVKTQSPNKKWYEEQTKYD